GGGLSGFGVSWTAGLLSGLADDIADIGHRLARTGEGAAFIGPVLQGLGVLIVWLGVAISTVIWPLIWLRDQIQPSSQPVWADFAATAAIVSVLVFVLSGGIRSGWRSLMVTAAIFAG